MKSCVSQSALIHCQKTIFLPDFSLSAIYLPLYITEQIRLSCEPSQPSSLQLSFILRERITAFFSKGILHLLQLSIPLLQYSPSPSNFFPLSDTFGFSL